MPAVLSTLNPPLQEPSPLQEPLGPLPYPPIHWPRAPDLTQDQKCNCQLLHSIGWFYSQIHRQLGYTIRQIGGACQEGTQVTPKK